MYVEGEISGFSSKKYTYFSLIDSAQGSAGASSYSKSALRIPLINCAMWRFCDDLKNGDRVVVHGKVGVFQPQGRYQLIIDSYELQGDGAKKARLEKLKKELEEKGYFDQRAKKPLPDIIKSIALVTALGSAAEGDVYKVFRQSDVILRVRHYHASVQGENAPGEIARAIQAINRAENGPDAIILTRGGGSTEDLSAFDEELCFEAVHNSRIPVICAIGHERDLSITEMCADVHRHTPTAAAEAVAERCSRAMYLELVTSVFDRCKDVALTNIEELMRRVSSVILENPRQRVERQIEALAAVAERIKLATGHALKNRKSRLELCFARIDGASPYRALERGYALLYKGGKVIGIKGVEAGDDVEIVLNGGKIDAAVKGVRHE